MSRPASSYVSEIGPEVALPFVACACARRHIPHNGGGEAMFWTGAFIRGQLRAVVGLASYGERGMIVSGIFSDGSVDEAKAVKMLAKRLSALPCDLIGTIILPNANEYRGMTRKGWQFARSFLEEAG